MQFCFKIQYIMYHFGYEEKKKCFLLSCKLEFIQLGFVFYKKNSDISWNVPLIGEKSVCN